MKEAKKTWWPWGIGLVYVSFALVLLSFVFLTSRNNVELVSKTYYEDGVGFQGRMEASQRAQRLAGQLSITFDEASKSLLVSIPPLLGAFEGGEVLFYRPSSQKLDFKLPLALDGEGKAQLSLPQLTSGYWKAQVSWKLQGLDYFQELALQVP